MLCLKHNLINGKDKIPPALEEIQQQGRVFVFINQIEIREDGYVFELKNLVSLYIFPEEEVGGSHLFVMDDIFH